MVHSDGAARRQRLVEPYHQKSIEAVQMLILGFGEHQIIDSQISILERVFLFFFISMNSRKFILFLLKNKFNQTKWTLPKLAHPNITQPRIANQKMVRSKLHSLGLGTCSYPFSVLENSFCYVKMQKKSIFYHFLRVPKMTILLQKGEILTF